MKIRIFLSWDSEVSAVWVGEVGDKFRNSSLPATVKPFGKFPNGDTRVGVTINDLSFIDEIAEALSLTCGELLSCGAEVVN